MSSLGVQHGSTRAATLTVMPAAEAFWQNVGVQTQPMELSMTVASEDMGCEMVYPHDSLILCTISRTLEFNYRFALLHMVLRSLQQAEEACIQIEGDGLLDLKIKFANAQFVQFFIHPLFEDDEDGIGPEPSAVAGHPAATEDW